MAILKQAVTLFIYNKGESKCIGAQRVVYSPDAMTNMFGSVETWTFAPRKLHINTKYVLSMFPKFVMTPDKYNPSLADKVIGNIVDPYKGVEHLIKAGHGEILFTVCNALKLRSTRKLDQSKLTTSTVIPSGSDPATIYTVFKGKFTKVSCPKVGTVWDRAIIKLFGSTLGIKFGTSNDIQIVEPTNLADMHVPEAVKQRIRNIAGTTITKIDGIELVEEPNIKPLRQRSVDGE